MTGQRIDRRRILTGAGALGAASALAALQHPLTTGAATGRGAAQEQGVLGAWIFHVTPSAGGEEIIALITFATGGVLVETDQNAGHPDNLSGPGHGAWRSKGNGTFAFTFIQQRFDAQGYAGTLQITGRVTLGKSGNTLHGTDTGERRDANGTLLETLTQRTTATRINVG